MKRHTPHLDEFDDDAFADIAERLDGFSIITLDILDRVEYGYAAEHPVCDFGFGDKEGLCIKEKYGCHIEGCDHADTD
jgi:hypothetical protein